MTFTIHGIGVSPGIAIGPVHVVQRDQIEVTEYRVPPARIDAEVARLHGAVTVARQQLRAVREQIPEHAGEEVASFIDTHLLMLEDGAFTQEPERIIRETGCNAEWALKLQRDALVAVFDEMEDAYLSTRRDDVDHVVQRIQRILMNQQQPAHEAPDARLRGRIVLADDLSPADTVLMQHHGVAAFATEYGGPTSHTAILARSLEIPGVVGLHEARRYVREDEPVVVDGSAGVLVVDPDPQTLAHYRARQAVQRRRRARLVALRRRPAVTVDGHPIALRANIELPRDVDIAIRNGAQGVGLYRTEFLYMNRAEPPSEEEHFQAYAGLVRAFDGQPVTIRTLDLGADKPLDGAQRPGALAANPALGLRAVRLALKDPRLFEPQLRAILRVSALGPVRMMIPMLSTLTELHQVRELLDALRAEFDRRGIEYDRGLPVGGMIEVPAAALCADLFARELDFLSIGTNDLIQYTIAIDRVNEEVNYLYDPLHPGVLRLIRMVIAAGAEAGVPVAMCGEMAGDPRHVRLLLALGLREFSVHPAALLEVKEVVTTTRLSEVEAEAAEMLAEVIAPRERTAAR